ncbi:inorganic diphosphatase [Saccharophagus sp. K07]|uniref:inorganic diphosphatase n=1 Tax=Saccharophagus sp. K07 TaxID=2283636 RepID=UPI0016527B2C|nr:inorganic diphosphatase [Saccharophagus sp. K07]MBC6905764.1 inorganic diphosphatase [Saccharophagus sp. K07]
MSLQSVPTGKNPPEEVNVIIEIPQGGDPIKYEIDKDSGALFVDRILGTSMRYPCNYGYIPHTLCGDGDPVDVLVVVPFSLQAGSVIKCRPIGVLKMSDESGQDAKLLAVPVSKTTPLYNNVKSYKDLPEILIQQIAHFFEHYKDLEPGKWVKVEGWGDADEAKKEILDSIENYKKAQ